MQKFFEWIAGISFVGGIALFFVGFGILGQGPLNSLATPTRSATPRPTLTFTITPSQTRSITPTLTRTVTTTTPTKTVSPSSTFTRTASPTITRTPTRTRTATPTAGARPDPVTSLSLISHCIKYSTSFIQANKLDYPNYFTFYMNWTAPATKVAGYRVTFKNDTIKYTLVSDVNTTFQSFTAGYQLNFRESHMISVEVQAFVYDSKGAMIFSPSTYFNTRLTNAP